MNNQVIILGIILLGLLQDTGVRMVYLSAYKNKSHSQPGMALLINY